MGLSYDLARSPFLVLFDGFGALIGDGAFGQPGTLINRGALRFEGAYSAATIGAATRISLCSICDWT